jgi:6,7-dimethyl-8-ribityllumazine synthase
MSSINKNLSDFSQNSGATNGQPYTVAIVVADWNKEITEALYLGAQKTLLNNGCLSQNIITVRVPGAFELPQAAAQLMKNARPVDAVICLGCVVKGDTDHNVYINHAVAQGLQNLAISHCKPFIFGLLTTFSQQQALDRAGGKHGNKGEEAAFTALQMLNIQYDF